MLDEDGVPIQHNHIKESEPLPTHFWFSGKTFALHREVQLGKKIQLAGKKRKQRHQNDRYSSGAIFYPYLVLYKWVTNRLVLMDGWMVHTGLNERIYGAFHSPYCGECEAETTGSHFSLIWYDQWAPTALPSYLFKNKTKQNCEELCATEELARKNGFL